MRELTKWLFWVFRPIVFMALCFGLVLFSYHVYVENNTLNQAIENAKNNQEVLYAGFILAPKTGAFLHFGTMILACVMTSVILTYYVFMLGVFTTLYSTITRFMTVTWRKTEKFTYHVDPVDGNDIFFKVWGVEGARNRSRILP